jgi:multimeric flavodoxin WrbA
MRRVIGFSGSPRQGANTDRLVRRVLAGAAEAGAGTAFFRVADLDVKGCVSCFHCFAHGTCSLRDGMGALLQEIHAADAVVLGSPVYMGQMTGQLKLFFDRLLPLMDATFQTRLKKRPAVVLALTFGETTPDYYRSYAESTRQMLGFLGFTPGEILLAAGTRAPDDIEKQADLLARAQAIGAGLAR